VLLRRALVIDWFVRWWTVSWTPLAAAAAAGPEDETDVVAAMLPVYVQCRRRGVVDITSLTWTTGVLLTTCVLYVQGEFHW